MIDVEVARTFLKVAETGSFQLAAQHLNVTQSTVSARIRTLEDRLGRKVLDRTRVGASLNPYGRAFEKYAQDIVTAWEEGKRVAALGPGPFEIFRIGGEDNLWTRLLSPWLIELRAQFPQTDIKARAASAEVLTRDLLNGELDLAVVHQAPAENGLVVEHLLDDELIPVTTDPEGRFTDRYVDVRWGSEGPPIDLPSSLTSIDLGLASVNFLMSSQSAGYVPRRLVNPYLAAGYLYPVKQVPGFLRPVYALRQQGEVGEALEKGLAMLRTTTASSSADKLKDLADAFRLKLGEA